MLHVVQFSGGAASAYVAWLVAQEYGKENTVKHFARWVNGRIYKVCEFKDYEPWVKARMFGDLFAQEVNGNVY